MDLHIPPRLLNMLPRSVYADPHTVSSSGLTQIMNDLPQDQPLVLIDSIVDRIAFAQKNTDNPRGQLKEFEQLLVHADPVLKHMEKLLDQARLPLDSASKTAANSADRLLKHFIEAYIGLSHQLQEKWFKLMYRRAHALTILRASQLCYRRAMVAHRAYTNGSPRRWAQLQALLATAKEHEFSDQIVDPDSPDTVERMVIQTTLMALTDPATLGGKELSRLRFYVERHAQLAQLSFLPLRPGDRVAGIFLLSDSTRGPKRFKPEHRLKPKEAVLDCRPLLAQVQKHLSGLRGGSSPSKLGLPLEAKEPAYGFMLSRCVDQWSEPRIRKDERDKVNPGADLVSGFDSVRHFLASAAFRRRRSDSLEGLGNGLSVSSEWAIVDQSPSGFGLRYVSGHAGNITVGELVAMRPAESASVYICVARRARTLSETDLEIGLETLGEQGVPASMSKPMPKGGQVAVPVLLLPKVTKLNNGPGLIAPIGDVKPGMSMVVPHKGKMVRLEAVATVERMSSCELIQLKKTDA